MVRVLTPSQLDCLKAFQPIDRAHRSNTIHDVSSTKNAHRKTSADDFTKGGEVWGDTKTLGRRHRRDPVITSSKRKAPMVITDSSSLRNPSGSTIPIFQLLARRLRHDSVAFRFKKRLEGFLVTKGASRLTLLTPLGLRVNLAHPGSTLRNPL